MSKKPIVAVVGRPNVGKSTFFNKICGRRISIVKDEPGVTRDRVYADAEWCGHEFVLIDTGGIVFSDDELSASIKMQAQTAIDLADVIVFLTDGKDGVVSADFEIANLLRRAKKPVVLTVNKLDNFELALAFDFYQLGLGDPAPISCEQSKGLGDLLDLITGHFDQIAEEPIQDETLKVALVGKPNVGKSSLINKILGFDRVIVSPVAGTTRDAIDTPFRLGEKKYTLIDTAGLRRKRAIDYDTVESYSVMRSLTAINRADVVLILMDSGEEISEQDVRIAGLVHEANKPSIVVMNKWDTVEKDTFTISSFETKLKEDLKFMPYFESIFVSALTGKRIDKIFDLVGKVHKNAGRRITTGVLNDVVREAVALSPPPSVHGRRLKVMYATQPDTYPPRFVFFVNDETLVHFSYKRYLENVLRKSFDFSGTPIKLFFNGKKDEET
ncbi:MAG: ribosome biogenesis GTPase Der [Firmicutes bacterium]|nr:ribosome biogenesis GTPase Der [Bacillota bacterium]